MAGRWLQEVCRVYLAMVIVSALLSLGAFAGCYLPVAVVRGYELVLERAGDIAMWGTLLTAAIGIALCLGCFRCKVEPPDVLARCTLIAILLCAFTLFLMPAIAVP
jgi:hypothetical protein